MYLYLYFKSMLEADFLNLCTYVQTQKYTPSKLSKLMYLFSNSSILEVDFQNLCIHVQTQ